MHLGEWIKKYRKEHGISMQKMAEMTDFSKAYIGMLEKGINPSTGKEISPTMQTFNKIAIGVGMDVNDLIQALDGDQPVTIAPAPSEPEYTDEEKGIIRGYRKAPDDTKQIVRLALGKYMKDDAPAAPPKEQPKEETKEEAPKIGKWGQVILDHDMLIYSESNIAAKDEVESLAYNPQFEKIVDDTYKELEERDIEYEFFVDGLIKMVKNNRDNLFKILDKPHHVAVRFLETRIRSKMR